MARADLGKGLEHSVVAAGVVELVGAIVGEEVVEGPAEEFVGVGGVESVEVVGIAERAPDEHGSAVSDIAGDEGIGQGWFADVSECGIYRVAEVERGIDERTVEVEDKKAGWNTEHAASVSTPLFCLRATR
jgi:hypothetical protein